MLQREFFYFEYNIIHLSLQRILLCLFVRLKCRQVFEVFRAIQRKKTKSKKRTKIIIKI